VHLALPSCHVIDKALRCGVVLKPCGQVCGSTQAWVEHFRSAHLHLNVAVFIANVVDATAAIRDSTAAHAVGSVVNSAIVVMGGGVAFGDDGVSFLSTFVRWVTVGRAGSDNVTFIDSFVIYVTAFDTFVVAAAAAAIDCAIAFSVF
jgi:hypothetical protein